MLTGVEVETLLSSLYIKKRIRENHKTTVQSLKFNPKSPNENLLATIGSNHVTIYNNDNLKRNHLDLYSHYINGPSKITKSMVTLPNGNEKMINHSTCLHWMSDLICLGTEDGFIHILSIELSKVIVIIKAHEKSVLHLEHSGNLLFSQSGKEVKVWDIKNNRLVHTLNAENVCSMYCEENVLFLSDSEGYIKKYSFEMKDTFKISISELVIKLDYKINSIRKFDDVFTFTTVDSLYFAKGQSGIPTIVESIPVKGYQCFDVGKSCDGIFFVCFGFLDMVQIYKWDQKENPICINVLTYAMDISDVALAKDFKSIVCCGAGGNLWKWTWISKDLVEKFHQSESKQENKSEKDVMEEIEADE